MSQERFPKPNRKEGQQIIRALIEKDPIDAETKAILAGVNSIKSPKIVKPDEKSTSSDSEIMISLEKGSIELLIYNIIQSKYSYLNVYIGEKSGHLYLYTDEKHAQILKGILHDPAMVGIKTKGIKTLAGKEVNNLVRGVIEKVIARSKKKISEEF